MSKQATFNRSSGSVNALAESALFASRQAWLAGLGAASISREWARHGAGNTFRALVRQGSAVEKNAIRVIGDRVESSIATATSVWRVARTTASTALATANRLAETAVAALPSVAIPAFRVTSAAPKRRKPAKTRAVKARATRTVRSVKRRGRKAK